MFLLLSKFLLFQSSYIYNYINNILITHSDEITKKSEEEEGELLFQFYDDIQKDIEKGLIVI